MGYVAQIWGSHQDNDNDDCWQGADPCGTETEARSQLDAMVADRGNSGWGWAVVKTVDGTIVHERTNPSKAAVADDADDRSERAIQAGMAFGVRAYNEANGDEPDDAPAFGPR